VATARVPGSPSGVVRLVVGNGWAAEARHSELYAAAGLCLRLGARACYALASLLSVVEKRPTRKEARHGTFSASVDLRHGWAASSVAEKPPQLTGKCITGSRAQELVHRINVQQTHLARRLLNFLSARNVRFVALEKA
jgi:hypothetical protein